MAIPAVVILGVIMWLITSAVKYWYYKRTTIKYTHKLDDKILEELRKPSPEAFEKLKKMKKEGHKLFTDESASSGLFASEGEEETEKTNSSEDKTDGDKDRPRDLFEEMEYRSKHKNEKGKRKEQRFDRKMFYDDPLYRLYRDVALERKKMNGANEFKQK